MSIEEWKRRGRDAFERDPLRPIGDAWEAEEAAETITSEECAAWYDGHTEALNAYLSDLTPRGRSDFTERLRRVASCAR